MSAFFKNMFILSCLILSAVTTCSYADTLKKINLAAMEWPPFYGEKLPENGFIAALTREALHRSGYELEIEFMPWKRALNGTQLGLYDGVLGLYYSEDRVTTLAFTKSIYQSEQVFVKKAQSNTNLTQPERGSEHRVAVQFGTLQAHDAQQQGFEIYATYSNSTSLKLLLKERVQFALLAREHLLYMQHEQNAQNIAKKAFAIVSPPFRTYKIYNAFSRKHSQSDQLVDAFNRGFLTMKQDGSYDAILARFGFMASPEPEHK